MPSMSSKGFSNLLMFKNSIYSQTPKLLFTSNALLLFEIIIFGLLSPVSSTFEMLSAVKATVSQYSSLGDSSKTALLSESTAEMLFGSSNTTGLLCQINFLFSGGFVPRLWLPFSFASLLSTYDDKIIIVMWRIWRK
ncbi:unnamed protein product [Taenia asiatica]|uniref:SERPIN domain-containing protein n=1 Tax=Taenia asiatica TaxID=60517 RepID=A0A0R3WEA8_TAEAS|nr:unnamed protein product [Taenia asiatica]